MKGKNDLVFDVARFNDTEYPNYTAHVSARKALDVSIRRIPRTFRNTHANEKWIPNIKLQN